MYPQPKSRKIGIAIDLCCGLGGLSVAAKKCGISPILGVDTSEAALTTYRSAFPKAQTIRGDIGSEKTLAEVVSIARRATKKGLPLFVFSGPPCQGFSMAGPRKLADPRNSVITAVSKAIARLKPVAAIIENVPTILSARHTQRLTSVTLPLKRAGYRVTRRVLDAQFFGVPQRRRRAFLIILKKGISDSQFDAILERYRVNPITVAEAFRGLRRPPMRPKDPKKLAKLRVLHGNHIAMRHSKKVRRKIALLKPGEGPLSYRRLFLNRPAQTLISGHRAPPAHPTQARSITVREAARLQGFPDDFEVQGSFFLQLGQVTNAVPPPLAESVTRAMLQLREK